jgi:hypothetical protein
MSEQFSGQVTVVDAQGRAVFTFDSAFAVLDLGATGNEGDLRLRGDDGATKIHLDGGRQLMVMTNAAGETTIQLEGNSGDIRLLGADCAEEFDLDDPAEATPGTVLTISRTGRLRACTEPYDRRVAGVVSGAMGFRPGIVMDGRGGPSRTAVALTGKVYCRVDARPAPIEVGDLLTSSATVGHAMRASEPSRAFGATLGKALQPLPDGTGLIPVLVALH